MACVPVVNVEIENCALQVFPTTAQVSAAPRLMAPSLNCTVPVGGVVFGAAVTVAVKTTFCPMSDGLIDVETSVVVAALVILKDCSTFGAAL